MFNLSSLSGLDLISGGGPPRRWLDLNRARTNAPFVGTYVSPDAAQRAISRYERAQRRKARLGLEGSMAGHIGRNAKRAVGQFSAEAKKAA